MIKWNSLYNNRQWSQLKRWDKWQGNWCFIFWVCIWSLCICYYNHSSKFLNHRLQIVIINLLLVLVLSQDLGSYAEFCLRSYLNFFLLGKIAARLIFKIMLKSLHIGPEHARYHENDSSVSLLCYLSFPVRSVLKVAPRVVVSCGIICPRLVLFLPQKKTQYLLHI